MDSNISTPGMTGNRWFDRSQLPRSPGGLIQADPQCRVPGFERVYVAGSLDEAAALGATPFVLGPDGPGADLHPTARLPLAMYVLQALAFGAAVGRGLDLEAPRHLEQVVVIEEQ